MRASRRTDGTRTKTRTTGPPSGSEGTGGEYLAPQVDERRAGLAAPMPDLRQNACLWPSACTHVLVAAGDAYVFLFAGGAQYPHKTGCD